MALEPGVVGPGQPQHRHAHVANGHIGVGGSHRVFPFVGQDHVRLISGRESQPQMAGADPAPSVMAPMRAARIVLLAFRYLENQAGRGGVRQQAPLASVMRASAVAARRPTFSVRPSVRTTPVSPVMPLMKETLNSSVV